MDSTILVYERGIGNWFVEINAFVCEQGCLKSLKNCLELKKFKVELLTQNPKSKTRN
jgi:hypothetical protein